MSDARLRELRRAGLTDPEAYKHYIRERCRHEGHALMLFFIKAKQSYNKVLACIRPTCNFRTDPMDPRESPGSKDTTVQSFWLPPSGQHSAIVRILPKGAFSSGLELQGRFRDLLWIFWLNHENRRQPFLWSLNMLTTKILLNILSSVPRLCDPNEGFDLRIRKDATGTFPVYVITPVEKQRPMFDWEREWLNIDLFETGGKRE